MDYNMVDVKYQVKKIAEMIGKKKYTALYGVPKNGLIVAALLSKETGIPLTGSIAHLGNRKNVLIVDDIIDSGKTIRNFSSYDCCALVSKISKNKLPKNIKYVCVYVKPTEWINWFWEDETKDKEDTVIRSLEQIGEDPKREGLLGTPGRVVRSYEKIYGGYKQKPEDILKTSFSSYYDEIILLKNIPLASTCEHHMLPFIGTCHIAYIPGKSGKVIGISKLARLMEIYARRLQIQEQLTLQIGEQLVKHLKPRAAAVIIQASHLCMGIRGVEKPGSSLVTSYMYGFFKTETAARAELFSLIKL